VVNPSFPARTVPEFIAYAKANPGKIIMASGGIGNSTHVSGERFKMMTSASTNSLPNQPKGFGGWLFFPALTTAPLINAWIAFNY
jgi:tripartite-type tricarboxylate transporter receptor subunit TctC